MKPDNHIIIHMYGDDQMLRDGIRQAKQICSILV